MVHSRVRLATTTTTRGDCPPFDQAAIRTGTTQVSIAFLISASRARALAPTTSPTFSPFLNSRKVGMAVTLHSDATSDSSSTSTLRNLTSVYVSENLDVKKSGQIDWRRLRCVETKGLARGDCLARDRRGRRGEDGRNGGTRARQKENALTQPLSEQWPCTEDTRSRRSPRRSMQALRWPPETCLSWSLPGERALATTPHHLRPLVTVPRRSIGTWADLLFNIMHAHGDGCPAEAPTRKRRCWSQEGRPRRTTSSRRIPQSAVDRTEPSRRDGLSRGQPSGRSRADGREGLSHDGSRLRTGRSLERGVLEGDDDGSR